MLYTWAPAYQLATLIVQALQRSLNKRLRLLGTASPGVYFVQVGAATETELEDRKLRIEDAKNATFAAVEEGIVPGGGAVFLHLSELVSGFKDSLPLGEEQLGAEIVFKSLSVSHSGLRCCCALLRLSGLWGDVTDKPVQSDIMSCELQMVCLLGSSTRFCLQISCGPQPSPALYAWVSSASQLSRSAVEVCLCRRQQG